MELLRAVALSFLNTPYRWAGDDPTGLDCSGLVIEILKSVGLAPPNDVTAQGLFDYFEAPGSWNKYSIGALAFYGQSVTKITHVAMLLDQHRIIEAGGGGSKVTDTASAIAVNAFVRIRPIRYRSDLVAVIKPSYYTIGYP